MAKNLSMSKIKKVSKLVDETEQHIIENGKYKGEQITFNPLFNNIKIEEILMEFGNLMVEAEEQGIEIPENMQVYFMQMLIIRHFTHFKNDIPTKLIGDGNTIGFLDALEHFRKTELFDECFINMFSNAEVRKVFDKVTNFNANGLLAIDINNKIEEKYSKLKLQNRDIFEQLDLIK